MTVRVYRLNVTSWPTDDGLPWARLYGDTAAAPNHEIPEWLESLIAKAAAGQRNFWRRPRTPWDRVADRVTVDDNDRVVGVLMPKPHRRNYLSASGAYELARDMGAFGARVVVERSAVVSEWITVAEVAP